MISSSEIKFLKSLSQKKNRDENSMFVVEGEKLVKEALASDFEVVKVYYANDIGLAAMGRITLLAAPSPAYAVLKMKQDDNDFIVKPECLYLMLDTVKDPGNFGTILRIAEWFGLEAIIASKGCVELYNPKVVQASMGSIFRSKVIYRDLAPFLEQIIGLTNVYGTYPHGPSIYSQKPEKEGIIVMGGESDGISPALEKLINRKISVPPFNLIKGSHPESLNVAVAAALICSEFRRPSV